MTLPEKGLMLQHPPSCFGEAKLAQKVFWIYTTWMLDFKLNTERCTRCGACAADCPSAVIIHNEGSFPSVPEENEPNCIQCQHCLAVCPAGAISIFGIDPDSCTALGGSSLPSSESMSLLIRARRSVRQYRQENLAPHLIDSLLKAVANAPSGVNMRKLTFTVISSMESMNNLRESALSKLKDMGNQKKIPPRFSYLVNAVSAYENHNTDIIFRNAPHALIVSASPDAVCPHEDVSIALTCFDLLAQSSGLGTVWWGMLSMLLGVLPELREKLSIPRGHHFYGMLFGKPSVTYARTVRRDEAAAIKHIEFK